MMVIIGSMGFGKMMIINIFNCFYEIQKGVICIDGEFLLMYDLEVLCQCIVIVFQDVFFFGGLVFENIILCNENIICE